MVEFRLGATKETHKMLVLRKIMPDGKLSCGHSLIAISGDGYGICCDCERLNHKREKEVDKLEKWELEAFKLDLMSQVLKGDLRMIDDDYKSLFNVVSPSITSYDYDQTYKMIQEMIEIQEKAKVVERAARAHLSELIDKMSDAKIQEIRQYKPLPKSERVRLEAQGRIPKDGSKAPEKNKDEKAIEGAMLAFNMDREQAIAWIEKMKRERK